MKRKWTESQKQYVIENYKTKTLKELSEHTGKTIRAITIFACRNGISKRDSFTEEQIEFIKKNYGNMTSQEIAEKLGTTKEKIKCFCRYHKIKSTWLWTDEEIEYLKENYGIYGKKVIAKKLNVSERAVVNYSSRLKIGGFKYNTDRLNAKQVSELLGVNRTTVCYWLNNGFLTSRRCENYRLIKEENLIEFMNKYPNKWKAINCDKDYFKIYDWFNERYHKEHEEIRRERWKDWQ